MTGIDALPQYAKPPVVETVLGVFYRPAEGYSSAYQGALWERFFREEFPKVEERAPLEEIHERFGEDRLAGSSVIRWQVSDRPEAPRLWAVSSSGEHVLQIQRNALFANWLKPTEDSPYRGFLERREQFAVQLQQLDRFLREEGIGRVEPTSCVVTYINHVEYEGLESIASAVAGILTFWTNETSDGWLPSPDNLNVEMAFPMPDHTGRLNVHLSPAIRRSDKRQLLRLDLTARGPVKGRELSDAIAWIDKGHEWIVRGFASLTPLNTQQSVWKRIQ